MALVGKPKTQTWLFVARLASQVWARRRLIRKKPVLSVSRSLLLTTPHWFRNLRFQRVLCHHTLSRYSRHGTHRGSIRSVSRDRCDFLKICLK